MTQREHRPEDESTGRAASLLAEAIAELHRAAASQKLTDDLRSEVTLIRNAVEQLARGLDQQLKEDKEQRLMLAGQLTSLATSLERLVGHLQGLSQLMTDLLGHIVQPPAAADAPLTAPAPPEPAFQPGGEGVALSIGGVPGFQALMDVQKALTAMDAVAGASVERFQEGESRIALHLSQPVTADDLVAGLHKATTYTFAIEEAKPELLRLRLRIVPA